MELFTFFTKIISVSAWKFIYKLDSSVSDFGWDCASRPHTGQKKKFISVNAGASATASKNREAQNPLKIDNLEHW